MTQSELEFVTQHRRHLHQHPELSFQEHETTQHIIELLEELEIPMNVLLRQALLHI